MTPRTFHAAKRVSLQSSPSRESGWVCQPYVRGTACSVSLIGGGVYRPPIILPAGNQKIEREGSLLRYRGGTVPCNAEHAAAIAPLALALANAIGPFSGWLGADMCVSGDCQMGLQATIIEVNPRLCTSYVGYRLAARQNLAAWLLQQDCPEQPEWHPQPVDFLADGRCPTGTASADA
jgi:predicted ATP-grasp superfamily ATP-dependent carboligase